MLNSVSDDVLGKSGLSGFSELMRSINFFFTLVREVLVVSMVLMFVLFYLGLRCSEMTLFAGL